MLVCYCCYVGLLWGFVIVDGGLLLLMGVCYCCYVGLLCLLSLLCWSVMFVIIVMGVCYVCYPCLLSLLYLVCYVILVS